MNKEVETQYKNLLDTADKISEMYNKESEELTDDDIEKIFEMIDSENDDQIKDLPSNNGKMYNENTDPSQNISEQVLVSANPSTGILNTIPYDNKNITEEDIDNLLNMKDEDLRKIEIGKDAFNESVKSMYPDADEEGIKKLLDAVNKYRQGIKFPYFNELPDFIKKEIETYVNAGSIQHQASGNTIKQLKNSLAKELFDTLITNNYSSKAFTDLSNFTINEINKEKEKLEESIVDYNSKLREEYEVGFIKKAEALENSDEEGAKETAKNLRATSRMFTQSYTYEDMYDAYKNGKIKVKNIQIDKFNRTCQEFNRKYYNNTFKIKDVGMTIPVLDRVLDKKYNVNTIKKFIVAFINYTRNFIPSNIDEHVFMFYFIQHILALDIKIPGDEFEDFNEIVKQNIYKFLDLIIEKDTQKEELRKGMKK